MPRTKPDETSMQLVLPVEAKQALEKMAEIEEIRSVSELVRQLLSNYCHQNGLDVSFDVGSWGGARKTLKGQESDQSLRPVEVKIDGKHIQVELADGRIIAHPLAWYPWLEQASAKQRANFLASPTGIYWHDLEDGISIETLINGPTNRGKNHR